MKNSHICFFVLLATGLGLLAGWRSSGRPDAPPPGSAVEGGSALEALRSSLSSARPAAWQSLVEALGRDESPGARSEGPSLLAQVYSRSSEAGLRAGVLASLEALGSPQACGRLAEIFRLGNEDSSQAAMRLSRIKDLLCAARLKIIIEEEKRSGELARAALRALGRTRSRAAADFCGELCAATYQPAIRREAAEALGRIAENSSVPVLAKLLGDGEAKVRQAAIQSLGLIRCEPSRQALEMHRAKKGLGGREADLVEEALGRLLGREPARLR